MSHDEQQRLLLKWHRHAPTITDQLPRMFDEGLFADVTLSINGDHLKAHRLILASCSQYFLQIFQEADKTNIEHPFVVLLNTNLEDFKAILNFMYKGECCVYKDRLPHVLTTARHLKVCGLSDMEINPRMEGPNSKVSLSHNINNESLAEILINDDGPSKYHRDVPETCKCFVCGKYLSNQYNLRVHMETHEETYHACSSCPHISRSRDALRKHMSYRHPDKYNARKQKKLGVI